MKDFNIPLLTAEDIDCRVQSVSKAKNGTVGAVLLLYKDARVDMRILDQVFGPGNWQRTHELINGNLFCTIEIWDDEKAAWVKKQDVGVESNTEKEKGQASDAFKRAGFNVGIGRELYSAPFTYVERGPDDRRPLRERPLPVRRRRPEEGQPGRPGKPPGRTERPTGTDPAPRGADVPGGPESAPGRPFSRYPRRRYCLPRVRRPDQRRRTRLFPSEVRPRTVPQVPAQRVKGGVDNAQPYH